MNRPNLKFSIARFALLGSLVSVVALSIAGCASDEATTNASGDKRTVRQAEPLRDIRNQPATVTGSPR
jgi:hypothetical protein